MRVYHYTTTTNLNNILSCGNFHPSAFITSDDSTYGPGWYFTDLQPSTSILTLLLNLWKIKDNPLTFAFKAKSYLEYEIHPDYLESCRPHVYRLKNDILDDGILEINKHYYVNNENNIVIRFIRHGNK